MATVVLHRFPISNFSEKARVLLELSGVDYAIREHRAGLTQWRLVALSGQRKVPVIEHAGRVVHDSTAIAHYLDAAFGDRRRLVPAAAAQRAEALALEDEIDAVLGVGGPVVWIDDVLGTDRADELDLVALEVHALTGRAARRAGRALRRLRARGVASGFVRARSEAVRGLLARLARRLEGRPFLVGDEPTLADAAAVGLALHLEWPASPRLPAAVPRGRGVASLVEDPALRRFFEWRRDFYARHLG